jgi:hypothetical protein
MIVVFHRLNFVIPDPVISFGPFMFRLHRHVHHPPENSLNPKELGPVQLNPTSQLESQWIVLS